jgi:hypothetical protein
MRIPWPLFARLFFCATIAACTEAPPVVDVPTRILSRVAYDNLPSLTLTPGAVLCGADAVACTSDRIGRVAVGDSGQVAFAGMIKDPQVRMVGGVSGATQVIGRTGSGPGEYRSVLALSYTPTGALRVFDILQNRLLEFGSDGRVLATAVVPVPAGFVTAAFVGGELRIVAAEKMTRSGDSANVALYIAETGERRARKLRTLAAKQRAYDIGDMMPLKPPFAASPQWAVRADGGLIHSTGGSFTVDVFDSNGTPSLRFGFAVPPRRVTTADLERWRARSGRGLPARMQAAIRGTEGSAAPMHAAITRIHALANGDIWIREAEAETGDVVRWIVFAPDGTPRGAVMLGFDDDVVGSRGDAILVSKSPGSLRWYDVSFTP